MSKYIFKIIKNASLDKMKEAVNTVHERSGMSKRKIFNDMLHCTRKYGAGYYDYQIFAFYNLTEAQRATFMTRLISKKFNTFMNDYDYAHYLENKDEFNKLYKKYIGRDFIQFQEASKEEVREFCKNIRLCSAKCRIWSAVTAASASKPPTTRALTSCMPI